MLVGYGSVRWDGARSGRYFSREILTERPNEGVNGGWGRELNPL